MKGLSAQVHLNMCFCESRSNELDLTLNIAPLIKKNVWLVGATITENVFHSCFKIDVNCLNGN